MIPGTNLPRLLIDKGYSPMRRIGVRLVPDTYGPEFLSSVGQLNGEPCTMHVYWVKGDRQVVWGLHEIGPGTLVHPRPGVRGTDLTGYAQRMLSRYTAEEIYEAMWDRSIILQV